MDRINEITPDVYLSPNYLVLDFEIDTSHGDYGHPVHPDNKMLLACWKRPDDSRIEYKFGSEFELDELVEAVEEADFLVAHNAKYELGWLRRCGADLSKILVFDTKIAEYVLLGNLAAGGEGMAPRSTSLDVCAKRRGLEGKDPAINLFMKHGINPVRQPKSWLLGRCRRDVAETELLFKRQLTETKNTNRLGHVLTRCLLTPVLADMEFAGMALDPERVEKAYQVYVDEKDRLSIEIEQITGGINFRSGPQVAAFLYDELGFKEPRKWDGTPARTAKGGRKTDKATLASLKPENKRQEKFLSLRQRLGSVSSALSKNLEFFKGVCVELGGIFHAEFNQTVTATHRLSSSGIRTLFKLFKKPKTAQFQNLPNVFKPLFTARKKGWLVAEADGSQLEFRVAAQASRDPQMVADVLDPHFDAHITSAAARFKRNYDNLYAAFKAGDPKATKLRKIAKKDTFGPLYGKSRGTEEELRWIEEFRRRWSGFYEWSEKNVVTVLEEKRLVLPWGMRFYWPFAKMSKSGYVNVSNNVYNYPIQSFATAEIIPIAVAAFWHRVREAEAQDTIVPINTIHDSVLCEISPDSIELFKEIALEAFTTDVYAYLKNVYDYEFDLVPLGVGFNIGTHWADEANHEEEWNVYPDGRREKK